MFVKHIGNHLTWFNDTFEVNLNQNLYNDPPNANRVIDSIFDMENVITVEPTTCFMVDKEKNKNIYIKLEVTTKPINNEEDADAFAEILKETDGVGFAYAQKYLNNPPDDYNEVDSLYGGVRTKLEKYEYDVDNCFVIGLNTGSFSLQGLKPSVTINKIIDEIFKIKGVAAILPPFPNFSKDDNDTITTECKVIFIQTKINNYEIDQTVKTMNAIEGVSYAYPTLYSKTPKDKT